MCHGQTQRLKKESGHRVEIAVHLVCGWLCNCKGVREHAPFEERSAESFQMPGNPLIASWQYCWQNLQQLLLCILLAKFAATLIVSFVKLDDQNDGTSLDGCSCFSPLA